jgi:hypothetical protein
MILQVHGKREREGAMKTSADVPVRRGIGLVRALAALFTAATIAACGGGGGGGGDVEPPPPPPGGTGTGAGGVPIFWTIYEWNADAGSALAVRQTSDGGFVAAGFQQTGFTFATPPDLFVQKTNSLGVRQWMRRIPWTGGAAAYDVRQTADGGYIVVGSGGSGAGMTIVLLKLNADGSTATGWPKTYGQAGAESAGAVLPVNGGTDGYLVAGGSDAGPLYVLRVDAAGAVMWEKFNYTEFCGGGGRGSSAAMTRTADGNYVIAGRTGCFQWAGFLLKIDASNGNEIWRRIFDDANATAYTGLEAVVETADQNLVAAGETGSDCGPGVSGTCDALLIKTDGAGNETWRRRYGGAAKDGANGVALAADGSYLVAGYSHSYGGAIQDPVQSFLWMDAMLLKIAPDGATLWHKIKGLRPRGADSADSIVATTDGGFAIGGASGGDVMLAKFDANGDTVNLGALYDLTLTVPPTQGVVNFSNAVDVASTGAYGLIVPREVASALLGRLIAASGGAQPSTFCTGGGTYAFNPAVPATLVNGGSYTLTFTDCVIGPAGGEQLRINGGTTLLVDSVSGAPASGNYDLQMTASNLVLSIATVGTTSVEDFAGGLRIARTATGGNFAETVSTPAAATLSVTDSTGGTPTVAATYGPFSVRYTVPSSGAYSIGVAGDVMTAASGGNTFEISVLQPIVLASSDAQPSGGSYRLRAQDNSRVTVTISAGTGGESSAALAVDTNGDGTDDGTISVPWDFVF